ncbi:glycosyltransferase family 2 protein [Gynurincola endophyticus]|jgi:GT2 family glycosyltransferase|uniref:glycosyltransferase family 2 protein n=1 Tax=Gynurincola endophyticus TaxID=2479004 RepID=UPI000F8F4132|nr:glycosyltransferase [Gynurincola endophyticus]
MNDYSTYHKPISFVIITYNRPEDTLALLRNLCALEETERLLRDIVLVNNASTSDYSSVKSFIESERKISIKYIDSPQNLGVSKGRNFALQFTDAPILVLLDDDAELEGKNSLVQIAKAFSQSGKDGRRIGIVSFLVRYFENNQIQKNAFAHKQFDKYKDQSFFFTYYYAGGAHAILREVLDQTGSYSQDFFYGMEEYDFSYRMLEKGWSIAFTDSVVMLHKESPLGRTTKAEKWQMMWVNKSKVAFRYLPMKYFYSTSILWSLQYLKSSGFDLKGWWQGWKKIINISRTEKRVKISYNTLAYLKSVDARLSY